LWPYRVRHSLDPFHAATHRGVPNLVGDWAGICRACQVIQRVEPLEVRANPAAKVLKGCRIGDCIEASAPRGVRIQGGQEVALRPEMTVDSRDGDAGLARHSRYRQARHAARHEPKGRVENSLTCPLRLLLTELAAVRSLG